MTLTYLEVIEQFGSVVSAPFLNGFGTVVGERVSQNALTVDIFNE